MPSILANPFPALISSIPVANHAIEVEAAFWLQPLQNAGHLNIHAAIFAGNQKIQLSRQTILNSKPSLQKCVEILFWGYPSGMRGRQHIDYLKNLQQISSASAIFQSGWPNYYAALHRIGNLGISTITKLAYFHRAQFNNHYALILDRRIIELLAVNRWGEFGGLAGITYYQAAGMYLSYLDLMANTANQLIAQPDQLEFFLFSLGDSFI